MNQMKYRIQVIILLAGISSASIVKAQDYKLSISGYSDLTVVTPWGDAADEGDLEVFEALGGDDELVEDVTKVSIPGFNLIFTRPINEKLKFQGEIVNAYEEGELDIELLRSYIDYNISSKFSLQAGKFLTPIGYLNRNQRFYGYLNYSVETRSLVDKELGYVPLSTVGLKAYGSFSAGNTSAFNYQLSFGGMRGFTPEGSETLAGFELGDDDSASPGFSGLVEYLTYIGNTELIIGFSAYDVPQIVGFYVEDGEDVPFGEEAEELEEDGLLEREEMELTEFGLATYFRIDGEKIQFLGEYHSTKFSDELGNLDESSYNYIGYSFELVYKTSLGKKSFYPYIRFDGVKIADEGSHPFYGLELEGGEELENSYMPSSQEIIVGFAWDIIKNNRIKLEYGKFIEGPFASNNLKISTAFAF